MKIYGDTISPFVRMCLVTAHECGLSGKLEHVREAVKPTQANPKLTALSALGKIPILETDHHHPLYDSRVIIEYLAHVAGNKTLIPDDGVKRFRILTLQALSQGLADVCVAYRYETAARPLGLQWADWMARTEQRINAAIDDMDRNWQAELTDVTAGTIAMAVALAYIDFRLPAFKWRDTRPNLSAFHEKFSARESMLKTALSAS
ncbi:MAG TPA: glutathione S-transferase family protein [Aestuariivirga sp.]|nr:glutathione S-transferase family protein [Hyphomicrobiales bacterium]MBP9174009.1 glutathione S-transferase family protein [Hyphomicrobiales bacterium]MCC7480958.1 glutathione S-transferase family protein [Hyphomicrobiales bacterium]HQY72126.1 glutathione S-transferase family protein [Aestuariivirga sp.]HRA93893.1 glutathione S-transferase family protein [Aestuariivirga sp.]